MNAARRTDTSLLVVEDDPTHAFLMQERLRDLGVRTRHAPSRIEALHALTKRDFDLVILDMSLPDGSGLDIQSWLNRRSAGPPPVVFVTANDLVEDAVRAVQQGAAGYVVKRPNYLEQMAETVEAVLQRAPRPVPSLELPVGQIAPGLIGESPQMSEVRALIGRYADSGSCVLVTGETGTGKDLVARALHEGSPRASKPFVAVNCGAIAESLFESEVFGSVRGAYTGAVRNRAGLIGAAEGGTLFLDEVGELPRSSQAKLLRLLEDGSYRPVGATRELRADVRVIAATNRELAAITQRGGFREDLYYRLAVLQVPVPPLRGRRGDIALLARHFLTELCEGEEPPRLSPQAIDQLLAWPWPGNVRELKHALHRTLLTRRGGAITSVDLGSEPAVAADPIARRRTEVSLEQLAELLTRHRGRLGPVARELGVSIRTVQRRMKELHLHLLDFRASRY